MPVTQLSQEDEATQQRRREAFGAGVKRRRKARGLSQEGLAEVARCDRQTVNRLENGHHAPALDRILWIAEALGCAPAELFPLDQFPSPARPIQPAPLPQRYPTRRPA